VTRAVELHDVLVAAIALASGLLLAAVLRAVTGWVGRHADRTRNDTDDVLVRGLRTLLPWLAVVAGVWFAVASLPLGRGVDAVVNRGLIAALVLIATITGAQVLADLVRALSLVRSGVAGSATIFVNIVRISVLAIGVLVLLQTVGVSVAPLLTAMGVGGLAVALALQDTLANLFAGVQILASKKVQPGDYIELSSGEQGYVIDINWRNTSIRQLPDNLVIVPNSQLAGSILTNYHQPAKPMSVLIQVGVAYDSDLALVERVTSEVGKEIMTEVDGGVPEHDPFIRFHTFGESSIDFSVILRAREFTNQYLVKHEFIKRLHARYQQEGIEIPFPIRTVLTPTAPSPTLPAAPATPAPPVPPNG
jgi:small-conductance mechanosensitive channel